MRILCYLILLTLEISKAENDTLHMNDPLPQNETEQSEGDNKTRTGRSLRIFYLTGPTRRRRASKLSDLKPSMKNLQRVNGKESKNLMDPYDRPIIVLSTTSWPIELQETEQPMGNIKWKSKMPMPPYGTVNMKSTLLMPETTYNDGIDQQYMDNTKIYGMHDKRRKKQPWKTKFWPVKKITKQWYPNNDGMYTRYKSNTKMYTKPWKYSSAWGRITKISMTEYPFTMVKGQQYSDFTGTYMTNFKPASTIQDYYTNYGIDDQYNYGPYDQYDNEKYDQYNNDYNMNYQTPSIIQNYNYYAFPPNGRVFIIPRWKSSNKMPSYRAPQDPLSRGRVQLRHKSTPHVQRRFIETTLGPMPSEKRPLRDRRNKKLPYPLAFRARKKKQVLYYPTEMPSEFNTNSISYKPGRASNDHTLYEENSEKTSINFPTNVFNDYGSLGPQTKLLGKRDETRMTDLKNSSFNYDYYASRIEKEQGGFKSKSNADQQETKLRVHPSLTTVDVGYVDKEPGSKSSERVGEDITKTVVTSNKYLSTSVRFSDDDIEPDSKSSKTNDDNEETKSKFNDYHPIETYTENADTENRTQISGKSAETA